MYAYRHNTKDRKYDDVHLRTGGEESDVLTTRSAAPLRAHHLR